MNPYEPRRKPEDSKPGKAEFGSSRLSEPKRVLIAWVAASTVTTLLLAAAFLFLSGPYAVIAALIAIALIGCSVPYLLLRIGKT